MCENMDLYLTKMVHLKVTNRMEKLGTSYAGASVRFFDIFGAIDAYNMGLMQHMFHM